MATVKQIEANRRNALKSTGPRTPEGKAAVSMNALKHGLRARRVVLPNENAAEFHQLCDDLEAEWAPQSRSEQFYLEQMAVSQWKLSRMEVGEASVFANDDASGKDQVSLLDRMWNAQHRMGRAYARAQLALERLQKARQRPAPSVSAGAPVDPPSTTVIAAEVGQAVPPVNSATVATILQMPNPHPQEESSKTKAHETDAVESS